MININKHNFLNRLAISTIFFVLSMTAQACTNVEDSSNNLTTEERELLEIVYEMSDIRSDWEMLVVDQGDGSFEVSIGEITKSETEEEAHFAAVNKMLELEHEIAAYEDSL